MPAAVPAAPDALARRRARTMAVVAVLAAVGVIAFYVFFIRTALGREIDELAYEGRSVVRPKATQATDRLLRTISNASLAFIGSAYVVVCLARHRVRLAAAVVVAIGGSVVSSEVLKKLLYRPATEPPSSIPFNSYPSGHATVGMALALGFVLVVAHHWRWLASIVAAVVATAFGTGVLTTGWHRPSDALGAFLVCLAWFSAVCAVLVAWRGRGDPERLHADVVEERASPAVTAAVAVLVLAALATALLLTLQAGEIRTVPYSFEYVAVCLVIDALGVGVVAVFHLLLRDVALDPPPWARARYDPADVPAWS
jgi:membrane-associated phospholipid phosphatase